MTYGFWRSMPRMFKNDELVNEFCRLKKIKRPYRRSPIEIEIDKSCGYDTNLEFVKEFTDFVFRFVYIPLLNSYTEI